MCVHSPLPNVVGDDWGRGKVKGTPSSWSGQYIKVKCFTVIGPAQLLLKESVQLDAFFAWSMFELFFIGVKLSTCNFLYVHTHIPRQ